MVTLAAGACALHARPAVAPSKMAELWQQPTDIERRDLRYGYGGAPLAPDPRDRYELLDLDEKGFSRGYDVRDSRGRLWSVKLGPEARTEVVVSRLVWAAGYRQPAIHYLPRWTLSNKGKLTTEGPARFRLEQFEKTGEWSWRENPFIGTRPFAGLFALMVMVNNWDVKTSQNAIYRISENGDAPRQWYVVKDLGASLGKTNWFLAGNRDDVDAFEKEPFIHSVEGNRVRFHYKGAWLEPQLPKSITPGDVVWTCELLSQLSSRQWLDAFRAGGYPDGEAHRYIRRLRQKIDDGLRLRAATP
jgi:hypothetical protein